jgi:rod shape-determining protein MreB
MNKGIIMTGGGALLPRINELIAQSTGVPCFISEEPLFCVIRGTGTVLEHLDEYKKIVMVKK